MRDAQSKIPAATVLYRPDPEILLRMLNALDPGVRRIYIAVNGPLDQQAQECLKVLPMPVIIMFPENIGLGAALNAIMQRAAEDGAESVLLLDQDSTPQPGMIEKLAERFSMSQTGDPVAAAGPLLIPPPGSGYLNVRYAWRDEARATVHFLPTSGSLISTAAWRKIGPFRADYFIGGIDVEWGFRAWSHGYSSVVAKNVLMEHRWGTDSGVVSARGWQITRHSNDRVYFYIRNTIDCLKQSYVPLNWKIKQAIILVVQLAVFIAARKLSLKAFRTIARAIYDGILKQMGPRDFIDI